MITSRILIAALLTGFANALPHRIRDSSINEPAVSAPNGTPITEGSQPVETPSSDSSSAVVMGDSSSTDSAMMSDSTSTSMMMDSASTMMMDTTSTSMMEDATSTTVAWNSYQTPTYGSGSSNWGSWSQGSNYNDCVSQCLAQYGNAPQPYMPPPTTTTSDSSSGSSSGSGATHTVIVAPSQGVFRYVPFALNASVGDTVRFVWGANNHTVTKSSELTPCNKTSDSPFTSGLQLKDFTFDQVVNDTNPTFFYCGVPTHCQKGMFGIINPPNAAGAGTSVSLMMSSWTSSNPDLAAYSAVVGNMTQNNTAAGGWGGNLDVANLPGWSQPLVAENVLYARSFLAANPDALQQDGTINLSRNAGDAPWMIPQDLSLALNNAGSDAGAGTSSAPVSAPVATSAGTSAPSTSASSAPVNAPNGAATASPKLIVALAAAAASFFLL